MHLDSSTTRSGAIPVMVLACALVVLGLLVYAVVTRDARLLHADLSVEAWWHARATEPWIALMVFASALGKPVTVIVGAACVVLLLMWRHRHFPPVWMWTSVPLAVLANQGLKGVVERQRPVLDRPLQTLESFSFPSGHAVGATVFYGLIAVWFVTTQRSRPARVAAAVAAVLMVATIAFSRIYLGVHFPSDVAAGISEGIIWLALCVIVIRRCSAAGAAVHVREEG